MFFPLPSHHCVCVCLRAAASCRSLFRWIICIITNCVCARVCVCLAYGFDFIRCSWWWDGLFVADEIFPAQHHIDCIIDIYANWLTSKSLVYRGPLPPPPPSSFRFFFRSSTADAAQFSTVRTNTNPDELWLFINDPSSFCFNSILFCLYTKVHVRLPFRSGQRHFCWLFNTK